MPATRVSASSGMLRYLPWVARMARFHKSTSLRAHGALPQKTVQFPWERAMPATPGARDALVQICKTSTISYSVAPAGVRTVTTSPTSLPTSERAIGEVTEIRFSFTLASSSPTIW